MKFPIKNPVLVSFHPPFLYDPTILVF
jgi:hypothetical protein